MSRERLMALSDEHRGFCRWSADRLRAWDESGRLAFSPMQTADTLLGPVPAADRLDAMLGADACAVDPSRPGT